MARPSKNAVSAAGFFPPSTLFSWAETLGESLGRGMARGINAGLAGAGLGANGLAAPRRRGRPPKAFFGVVAPGKECKVPGCGRPARSKGLCSAHYQAERRRKLASKSKASA